VSPTTQTEARTDAPLFIDEVEDEKRFTASEFWQMAGGFWRGKVARKAWALSIAIGILVLVNIAIQYGINRWNKYFFDALEAKNLETASHAIGLFAALAVTAVVAMVTQVWFRMTLMANWRRWLTTSLSTQWLAGRRFYQLSVAAPEIDSPEFRMTDDVRQATEPLVDFVTGIINALLMAAVFAVVLWSAGGGIKIGQLTIPGYFVWSAAAYGCLCSTLMIFLGRPLIRAIEQKNAAEAQSRFELVRIRENAESIALIGGESDERASLNDTLRNVLARWAHVIRFQSLITIVSHGNYMIAPVLPLLLGAPKYLAGEMSLGQLMQIAAAFVQVQVAFNWVVDNYIRLAEWNASAQRIVAFWRTMRSFEARDAEETRITFANSEDDWLRLSDLSVAHSTGKVVISDAWAAFEPGSKVLIKGESGTGKSTLIRAIAGLWPWGQGEVYLPMNARVMFVPQKPYVPNGTLRAALIYPGLDQEPEDQTLTTVLRKAGLSHLVQRLDDGDRWDKILSGGEQQRLAFARLFLHRPEIVIMDEATSALDEAGQETLMTLFNTELPGAMLLSVGHRPGLEGYHQRIIVLERRSRGATITEPEEKHRSSLGRLMRRALRPRPTPDPASEIS